MQPPIQQPGQSPMQSMSQQPGQPQQPPPGQSPQPQSPQGQPGQPGSGEQQMYDTVVGQSEEYIFGQGLENVKQRLQAGAEDGVEDDVGAIVGNVLAMNYQSAAESGRTIPPKVMAGAAKELTEVVTDIAVEMKLITPQEANAAADEALYVAMATFGKGTAQAMPPQERQQYQQLIQALQEAEAGAKGRAPSPREAQGGAVQGQLPGGQPVGAMP